MTLLTIDHRIESGDRRGGRRLPRAVAAGRGTPFEFAAF
jgi:hypothetical protein